MKSTNVILPVLSNQKIGSQFNALFDYLNDQQATVHLLIACAYEREASLEHGNDADHELRSQQYLKYERLDNTAVELSRKYPHLQFQLHVKTGHLYPEAEILGLKVNARLVIIDPDHLAKHDKAADVADMKHLIELSRLTFWTVSDEGYGAFNLSSAPEAHPQLAMTSA